MALGFYALGGGKDDAQAQTAASGKGINTELPGAKFQKGEAKDKMSLYNQAQRDSAAGKSK